MSRPAIDIDKLGPDERLELIGELWDSLREQPEALRIPSWHREELDSRLNEFDSGDVEVISWEDAKRRLRSRP